jgi:2-polyprenyl-6-methoxyphenol hydroxylase-like FAD-dependent oxidoreductase
MATLVENLHLQRALLKTIREQQTSATGGVELLDGVKVLGISPGEGGWPVVKVEGKDGAPPRHLRARLLVCVFLPRLRLDSY